LDVPETSVLEVKADAQLRDLPQYHGHVQK
jgi:hypothetical protein